MRRWFELVRVFVRAQTVALLDVGVDWLAGDLRDSGGVLDAPGASVPCDQGHWHYDGQHARICNELEAHGLGFRAVEAIAGEP